MSDKPSLFLFVLILMTMIEAIYLIRFEPFKTVLLQRLELFNEITSLVLLYTSLCLTLFVTLESTRDQVGYFFIGTMGVNIFVHLFYMVRSTVKDCKIRIRAKKVIKESKVSKEKAP